MSKQYVIKQGLPEHLSRERSFVKFEQEIELLETDLSRPATVVCMKIEVIRGKNNKLVDIRRLNDLC